MLTFIVIGAGVIGPRHAAHLTSREDCSLFAIVDHSAKGPSVANEFNTLLFQTLDELFDYCESNRILLPDAAIVATPNHTHLEMGLKLASNGIDILMEKPLAPKAEECRTLIDFCNDRGVKLLVGHHRRFNPYIIASKANITKVGEIVAVQGCWTSRKPDSYFEEKPWRSSKELGGGTILINLVHDLDLLQYLIGPIERVYAEPLKKQRFIEGKTYDQLVDEGVVLTIRFASGCSGTFICSDNVTSPFLFEAGTGENPMIPHNEEVTGFYRFFGTEGTLSVPDMKILHQESQNIKTWTEPIESYEIDINPNKQNTIQDHGMITPSNSPTYKISPIHMIKEELPKPFDVQLEHFVNLITGVETEIKCTGVDALRALLCVDAVVKSIESGLPQYVEPV